MARHSISPTSSMRASGTGKKTSKKWTEEEQNKLLATIARSGSEGVVWSDVARAVPGRTGKQCREKWKNDLRPDISKEPWTPSEEYTLARAHSEVGNQWAEIAKYMPGRSENSIKNHWNATLRSKADAKTRTFLWLYGRVVLEHNGTTSRAALETAKHRYCMLGSLAPEPLQNMIAVSDARFAAGGALPIPGGPLDGPLTIRGGGGTPIKVKFCAKKLKAGAASTTTSCGGTATVSGSVSSTALTRHVAPRAAALGAAVALAAARSRRRRRGGSGDSSTSSSDVDAEDYITESDSVMTEADSDVSELGEAAARSYSHASGGPAVASHATDPPARRATSAGSALPSMRRAASLDGAAGMYGRQAPGGPPAPWPPSAPPQCFRQQGRPFLPLLPPSSSASGDATAMLSLLPRRSNGPVYSSGLEKVKQKTEQRLHSTGGGGPFSGVGHMPPPLHPGSSMTAALGSLRGIPPLPRSGAALHPQPNWLSPPYGRPPPSMPHLVGHHAPAQYQYIPQHRRTTSCSGRDVCEEAWSAAQRGVPTQRACSVPMAPFNETWQYDMQCEQRSLRPYPPPHGGGGYVHPGQFGRPPHVPLPYHYLPPQYERRHSAIPASIESPKCLLSPMATAGRGIGFQSMFDNSEMTAVADDSDEWCISDLQMLADLFPSAKKPQGGHLIKAEPEDTEDPTTQPTEAQHDEKTFRQLVKTELRTDVHFGCDQVRLSPADKPAHPVVSSFEHRFGVEASHTVSTSQDTAAHATQQFAVMSPFANVGASPFASFSSSPFAALASSPFGFFAASPFSHQLNMFKRESNGIGSGCVSGTCDEPDVYCSVISSYLQDTDSHQPELTPLANAGNPCGLLTGSGLQHEGDAGSQAGFGDTGNQGGLTFDCAASQQANESCLEASALTNSQQTSKGPPQHLLGVIPASAFKPSVGRSAVAAVAAAALLARQGAILTSTTSVMLPTPTPTIQGTSAVVEGTHALGMKRSSSYCGIEGIAGHSLCAKPSAEPSAKRRFYSGEFPVAPLS